MKKIAIVHFLPIEYYPPTLNFLNYIANTNNMYCNLFTTYSTKSAQKFINYKIKINRYISGEGISSKILSFYYHLVFNIFVFLKLVNFKPDVLIYYESYSALPVYWYFKLFGKNKRLWMHSHEYFPPEWYKTGMTTVKYYHKKEIKYLYNRCDGLSQTNEFRNKLFLKDYPFIDANKIHTFPNYPNPNWLKFQKQNDTIKIPIKIVYIGTISLWANHLKVFCEWIIKQKNQIIFDIYTKKTDQETINYIDSLDSENITIYPTGIEYNDIPKFLKENNYQIGVILYKGLYPNTAWCASNKLFEYLNCGLDVWFTKNMPGTYSYITKGTYPKVIKVDFDDLKNFNLADAISHKKLLYKPFNYTCDNEYEKLLKFLVQ